MVPWWHWFLALAAWSVTADLGCHSNACTQIDQQFTVDLFYNVHGHGKKFQFFERGQYLGSSI